MSARYRFGGAARTGVLLGLGMRQSLPIVAGCLWLTLWLMAQTPVVGMVGPVAGLVMAFGRWRKAPLYDVAVPGAALVARRAVGRSTWRRHSLTAAGPGVDRDAPGVLRGLELVEVDATWTTSSQPIAVVRDRRAGAVSIVLPVAASGFAVSSLVEQDAFITSWSNALGPLARAQCPVARVTWQHWTHPAGLDTHRQFLANQPNRNTQAAAAVDYEELLAAQAPVTIGHEVLLTLTVELRRVRSRRGVSAVQAAVDALVDEARLLASRLEAGGARVDAPMSAIELSSAVRVRSDPARIAQQRSLRRSLAAATGRGAIEWGPLAISVDWLAARVDGSTHRSYRIAGWPMLPVPADWLAPLLSMSDATVTSTIVLEPVPLVQAAAAANRELTSIEADHAQKERHGFRLTARERRRQHDVETREQELASGHPEFRHAGFVTVTAADLDTLDDASARVEQAAAQAMLDLRPLAARQAEGWVCALPLGRNVRSGGWT